MRFALAVSPMSHSPQMPKEARANVSLTGSNAVLLRRLHSQLQEKHQPMNISLADTIVMALAKLDAELNK